MSKSNVSISLSTKAYNKLEGMRYPHTSRSEMVEKLIMESEPDYLANFDNILLKVEGLIAELKGKKKKALRLYATIQNKQDRNGDDYVQVIKRESLWSDLEQGYLDMYETLLFNSRISFNSISAKKQKLDEEFEKQMNTATRYSV